jgi:hypothetical protein
VKKTATYTCSRALTWRVGYLEDISPTACRGLCLCRRAACRVAAQPNAHRSGEAVASQSPQGQHKIKPVLAIRFMDRPPKQAFSVRDPVLQGRVVHT